MSPKVNTTLLSAAVISGLLVSAAPAQATETTDASVQSITVEQPETQTAPAVPATPVVPVAQPAVETVVETAPPVVEAPAGIVEDVAAEAPAEQAVVQEPQAPAEDSAEEIAPAAPLEETATTEPVEESTVVQDPATGTETDATQPADETSAATEETLEFGSVEESEEEAENDNSDNELRANSFVFDEEPEFSEELNKVLDSIAPELDKLDEDFLNELDERLLEGREDWTDAQWEAFYETDEFQQLMDSIQLELVNKYTEEIFTLILDNLTSEAQLDEFLSFLEELMEAYPEDSEWIAEFLASYFGEEGTEPEGEKPEVKPEAKPEAKPSEKPVEIKPAGTVDKKPENTGSEAAKGDAKPQASENELAETGFSGALLAAAGAGLLLMLAGAAMVLRRRKA
ncbi:LPXTG cell wall anchor domain-containing protein [Glutamicibacter protophormiae]|uniref:LPXTG cell wall anchor domain-containing protein n=1 Tax=Glutamicibacter protophormiae TaxID=37930 RepID=UPI003A8D025A